MRPLPLILCLAGCAAEGGSMVVPAVASSADPRDNVLVIDDGFDPTVPTLAPRLAGLYSVTCTGRDPAPVYPAAGSVEDRRAALLAALRTRDQRCHVLPGIAPKPDPLADISTYRPAWNRVVENQLPIEGILTPAQVAAIQRGLQRNQYHGTATASLIAHENPTVRLVLLEQHIDSDDEDNIIRCLDQGDLDRTVTVFSDEEVQRAYLERPPSTFDEELAALKQRHRIGLVNESFGYVSREQVERVLAALGCAAVELRPFFALRGELEERRARAHPQPEALLVKSAGNDGSLVAGPEDQFLCAPTAAPRLLVGAYDLTGALADFTNRGPCVDLHAPGVDVIVHFPAGWLMPVDGTSFSAPMTVRLLSLDHAAGPFTAAAARQAALDARDAQGRIPFARFPRALFYDPPGASAHWALRLPAPRPNRRAIAETFSLLTLAGGRR
jgi:hypothetical protein